jgi:uncharacterized protein (DUF1697 family)
MLKISRTNSDQFVAFLRGINVGGHAFIKMTDLKKAFEKMGFQNVRTLLASGNVIFESEQANKKVLTREIEPTLEKEFKQDIGVTLRSLNDLKHLELLKPFKEIKITTDIRLYITFLFGEVQPRTIKIPYATPKEEFRILYVTPTEVFSVLDLSKGKGTPDVMSILEKEFGSKLTTRNWNTILKILL